tara:strand:+ start:18945 stop:19142 length:198 start_codon:yes stop_codon:yes gene_type:complete
MNFNNLTNEQVEWLEQKIKEAYEEGADDEHDHHRYGTTFSESLAKNETCHILAERFMKCVEDLHE